MDQLWLQLGAFGALVGVVVSLVVALRTGTLTTGREIARLERAHAAQLEREQKVQDQVVAGLRADVAEWRSATREGEKSLRTALDANELLAQQADRLASGTELTQRLIETMRMLASGKGGP